MTTSARDSRNPFWIFSPKLDELASSSRSRKTGKIRLEPHPRAALYARVLPGRDSRQRAMKPIAPVRVGVAEAYECPIFKLIAFQTFFPLSISLFHRKRGPKLLRRAPPNSLVFMDLVSTAGVAFEN